MSASQTAIDETTLSWYTCTQVWKQQMASQLLRHPRSPPQRLRQGGSVCLPSPRAPLPPRRDRRRRRRRAALQAGQRRPRRARRPHQARRLRQVGRPLGERRTARRASSAAAVPPSVRAGEPAAVHAAAASTIPAASASTSPPAALTSVHSSNSLRETSAISSAACSADADLSRRPRDATSSTPSRSACAKLSAAPRARSRCPERHAHQERQAPPTGHASPASR